MNKMLKVGPDFSPRPRNYADADGLDEAHRPRPSPTLTRRIWSRHSR